MEKENKLVAIKVKRYVAQKLKVKATIKGISRQEYLEQEANKKEK